MNCLRLTKFVSALVLIGAASFTAVFSQEKPGVEKIIENENAFARFAAEKGVKAAFLEFLADDGLMFAPAQMNGKDYWRKRPDDSPATLTWYPIFADVSSNGALAYTTGRGEFRPKGKSDATVYYSDFFTVWRRQAGGEYRAALDVGVAHGKPPSDDKNWSAPPAPAAITTDENRPPAAVSINKFFDVATLQGLEKSYKIFAAEDIRLLREDKFPILGKKAALEAVKGKSSIKFGKQMTQQSAGNLAYVVTNYELRAGEKTIEKGSLIQMWKLHGGSWQIVFDVFAPVPFEQEKSGK